MTKANASKWWRHRGNAWEALATAERELLLANTVDRREEGINEQVRDVLGALRCARELLVSATELVQMRVPRETP